MKKDITSAEFKKYGIALTENNIKRFMKKKGALVSYENLNELEKDGIKYEYISDIIEKYAKNDYEIKDKNKGIENNIKRFMKKKGALVSYENLNELEKDGIKYEYISDIIEKYAKNDYEIKDKNKGIEIDFYDIFILISLICFYLIGLLMGSI